MAERVQTKSISWRCMHLHPFQIVTGPGVERRARCLGCGMMGPSRADVAAARRALQESFKRLESA